MAILGSEEIKKQVSKLFKEGTYNEKMIEQASYDLRLDKKYIKNGDTKIGQDGENIKLPSRKLSLLTTMEEFHLPENICARAGITFSRSQMGLFPLFGPQIDPGFEGTFCGLVYNMSDEEIDLEIGKKIFKLEFCEVQGNRDHNTSCKKDIFDDPYLKILTEADFLSDIKYNIEELKKNKDELIAVKAKLDGVENGYQQVTLISRRKKNKNQLRRYK
jgi:deoxycytidine triphosphate deaminase